MIPNKYILPAIALCILAAGGGFFAFEQSKAFGLSLPAEFAGFEAKTGGACAFDLSPINAAKGIVTGWSVVSAPDGVVSQQTLIGIPGPGAVKFVKADKNRRDDVATYFNTPNLAESGFVAHLPADTARGAELRVYQIINKTIIECPTKHLY